MNKLAIFILGFGILGGLAGMLSSMKYSSSRYELVPESELELRKRKTLFRGLNLLLTSLLGLCFLISGYANGIEVIIAGSLILALSEATVANMKPKQVK